MANLPLLTLLLASPIVGILAILFIPKENGRAIKRTAALASLVPLALSIYAWVQVHTNGAASLNENFAWFHFELNKSVESLQGIEHYYYEFRYLLGLDGLSLPLVLLTTFISATAAIAAWNIKKRWKTFYIMFFLLELGMIGVFLVRDLMMFFIFFELTLIPMFFLIGIWGNKERERAANQFLLYNGVGSALMLVAFLILISTAGFTLAQAQSANYAGSLYFSGAYDVLAKNLVDPNSFVNAPSVLNGLFHLNDGLRAFVFVLLLIAFGIKLPIFPFHTWMLKVHAEAPTSVVMIHSGILLKMGAYGLFRFAMYLFPDQTEKWAVALAVLGVINILYGAILAFVQKDLRLVLAYSSISHMGVVLLGIASLNLTGLEGAAYQLVSHGLISALMFLIVGIIADRTGTTELDRLGGMAKSAPIFSGLFLVAGMASLGLPATSGFVAELLAFVGLFKSHVVLASVGSLGIVLTAAYVLRAILKITYGPLETATDGVADVRASEAVPMLALVLVILVLGILPSVLTDLFGPSLDVILKGIGG